MLMRSGKSIYPSLAVWRLWCRLKSASLPQTEVCRSLWGYTSPPPAGVAVSRRPDRMALYVVEVVCAGLIL